MGIFEIVRFALAALCILTGLFVLGVATLGVFRLDTAMNRIQSAAKCDTLGAMLVLIGSSIIVGFSFTTLKLFFLIVFVWLTNPVAVYMISHAEVLTNPHLEDEIEVVEL